MKTPEIFKDTTKATEKVQLTLTVAVKPDLFQVEQVKNNEVLLRRYKSIRDTHS